jgi:hypothetical protein
MATLFFDILLSLVLFFGICFVVYVTSRLIFKAWFRTKKEEADNGEN